MWFVKKAVLLCHKESIVIHKQQGLCWNWSTNMIMKKKPSLHRTSFQNESNLPVTEQESAKPRKAVTHLTQPAMCFNYKCMVYMNILQSVCCVAPTEPAQLLIGLLRWVPPSRPSGKSSSCSLWLDQRLWLGSYRFQIHLR